jgi:hypothetical protein
LIKGERENDRFTSSLRPGALSALIAKQSAIEVHIGTGIADRPRALPRNVTAPLTKNRTLLAKIERRGNPEQRSICVRMRWHLQNHRDDIEICTGKHQCYCMHGISSLRTDFSPRHRFLMLSEGIVPILYTIFTVRTLLIEHT